MWAFSPEARAVLTSGDQRHCAKVEIWHSGRPAYVLEVLSGSVTADADRPVRRNFHARLVDPTGRLSRGDVDDLLNPYDCEIAPYRGVQVGSTVLGSTLTPNAGFGLQPFGTSGFGGVTATVTALRSVREEWAPHGVFALTGRSVSDSPDGLVIDLEGQDRSMGYQGPMSSALAISAGTPIETAIARLLATRNPGVALDAMVSGFTCGPLLFAPDIDVWAEAQELAASVGGVLYHDRVGQPVFALAGPASDSPVSSFVEGDGLLLSVDRKEDSDTIRNVVIVESPSGLIRAVAEDTNPYSPTFTGGRYGRRPRTIVNQHIWSVEQAQQAATTRLAYELGRSETVSFTAVPDPAMDVQEATMLHRPRAGLNRRALVVASLEMPLGVDEPMKVGCRRSVLTQDGRALPVSELVA